MLLEKSLYLVLLYDFYGKLLTPKQQDYLELYYEQDLTLGEIAQELSVSRQAVYDNIKRSENLLENYEKQLNLVKQYEKQRQYIDELEKYIATHYSMDTTLKTLLEHIRIGED